MLVLIAYATKYGGTQAIAERIAETLKTCSVDAVARPVKSVTDLSEYDAFVLGSALYMGSWMKEAEMFARKHNTVLANKPLWLFSSGPLGTATIDAQGHDVRETAGPKQLVELREMLGERDHRVFFGVSDHTHFDLRDKLIYALPAGKKLLQDGDFRDWAEVDAWATNIAYSLRPATVAGAPVP